MSYSEIVDINVPSPTGAGTQNARYSIGPGEYDILVAAIHSSRNYAESCNIMFEYELGDGSYRTFNLGGGFTKQWNTFIIRNVRVRGPGRFATQVNHSEATGVHYLRIMYRRFS